MVAEAKRRIRNVSVHQVAEELAAGEALLVDVREPGERLEHGVITGAFHAPRGELEFWADPTIPLHRPEFEPTRRIILHCAAGGRSALAADTLQQMGYPDLASMEGGFEAWEKAGLPVERLRPPIPEGDGIPMPAPRR